MNDPISDVIVIVLWLLAGGLVILRRGKYAYKVDFILCWLTLMIYLVARLVEGING